MADENKADKLSTLGEFAFIDTISARLDGSADVLLGIGDDCAATTIPAGEVLLTSKDLLIEDVHFKREWCSMSELGHKSAAVNLSDIAAMGGKPRHCFLGLGLPPQCRVDEVDAFIAAFIATMSAAGCQLAGGDTCASRAGLLISVTVHGSGVASRLCRRDGAAVGDDIYVSGTIGDSAVALYLLQHEQAVPPHLLRRHHRPEARLALGAQLAGVASAMIDVSDGLCADLGHILRRSRLGAEIDSSLVPLSQPLRAWLEQHPEQRQLALNGGEDYELLFTAAPAARAAVQQAAATAHTPISRIGTTTATPGLTILTAAGVSRRDNPTGFNHFAR